MGLVYGAAYACTQKDGLNKIQIKVAQINTTFAQVVVNRNSWFCSSHTSNRKITFCPFQVRRAFSTLLTENKCTCRHEEVSHCICYLNFSPALRLSNADILLLAVDPVPKIQRMFSLVVDPAASMNRKHMIVVPRDQTKIIGS
jgi:hypothetical protein